MAAARSSDDDEFRVGERDNGGEDSADGLAEHTTRGLRLGPRAGRHGQEPVHVDGRRPGLPQAELAEYLDERNRLALRAGRDEVRDLAGQAAMPAPYLAVADDRAAESLAEEEVGEVVQGGGVGVVTFGPRRPVHVVVDGDRSVDVRRRSKPEIYPIYWSTAQMQARQDDRMARVQGFLNSQWKHESQGVQWFDPNRDSLYPDRIRRRPQGADSAGLGTHLDPGNLDLWMTAAYQKAFRHLFDGTVEQYDPWDAAYRTDGPQYPGTTMCSAFRTFQGWTALSDMAHDQGVLHTVPIPGAMAYLMLRPLLADVPDDDMCGVTVNQTFPANDTWHPLLMQALSGIPDVQAGDSVSVALRHDPQRRARGEPAGLGQCHVHPRRPLVPAQRALRRQRAGSLRHRVQPQRLPCRALRTHLDEPLPAPRSQRHRPTRPRPAVPPAAGWLPGLGRR